MKIQLVLFATSTKNTPLNLVYNISQILPLGTLIFLSVLGKKAKVEEIVFNPRTQFTHLYLSIDGINHVHGIKDEEIRQLTEQGWINNSK